MASLTAELECLTEAGEVDNDIFEMGRRSKNAQVAPVVLAIGTLMDAQALPCDGVAPRA